MFYRAHRDPEKGRNLRRSVYPENYSAYLSWNWSGVSEKSPSGVTENPESGDFERWGSAPQTLAETRSRSAGSGRVAARRYTPCTPGSSEQIFSESCLGHECRSRRHPDSSWTFSPTPDNCQGLTGRTGRWTTRHSLQAVSSSTLFSWWSSPPRTQK